jgi:hypothetical protein
MSARMPETSGPLRIVIEPTATGRKWIARQGGRVLCIAAAPFILSARILLSEGYHPDAVIVMWRPNTTEWALRGRIGLVAATLVDGETAASCAKNRSPVREHARDKGPPAGHKKVPSADRPWRER